MKMSHEFEDDSAIEVGLHGEYIPSQAEIRRQCAEIRETWSERERLSRALSRKRGWSVPVYKVARST